MSSRQVSLWHIGYPPPVSSEPGKVKMRDSLFLEDLQLSPALACEGNHSSSPLPFLQHCQISAESGRRNCLETSPWLAVMQQFLSGFAVPKCWVCPWAYWIWRDVHCWLALKLQWIEDVCQLLANNASPLVQFMEKLKKEQVQTRLNAFFFFSCQRSRHRSAIHRSNEGKSRDTEKSRSLQILLSALSSSNLWPYVNFTYSLLGLSDYLLSQTTKSKFLCRKWRLLSGAKGTVVPRLSA